MKKLNYYTSKGICKEDVFSYFISTFRPSIQVWDYFVDWDKINLNLRTIKFELNILNSWMGSANFEKDFIEFIKKYPEITKIFPFLLAVRKDKLKKIIKAKIYPI